MNNTDWRIYFAEEMLHRIDPLDEEIEFEDDSHCLDEHFPVAIGDTQL